EVVLAIFRSGQKEPVKLESKSVTAGGRAVFDVTVDVPVVKGGPVAFDVRAGPARPGTIVINGPDLASKPADVPLPYITVDEQPFFSQVDRAFIQADRAQKNTGRNVSVVLGIIVLCAVIVGWFARASFGRLAVILLVGSAWSVIPSLLTLPSQDLV